MIQTLVSPGKATSVARLMTESATARRIVDAVAESFDGDDVAASAFETPGGQWTVAIHFREPPNEAALRALIALAAGAKAANALTFETLEETDWVKASQQTLTPIHVGRFTVHGAHDRGRVAPNRIAIEIEAALAFGTGYHGTTRGCLVALDDVAKRHRSRRANLLDVGTGTGVLSIAAACALHANVLASDIDPRSVRAARSNARINRVHGAIETIRADGVMRARFRARAPYDLILANILLGPLKRFATPLSRLVARRGRVVLSGLLPAHANAALAAYRAGGLALERRILIEGWVTLVLARGGARSRQ
jgi:ribosomal protein L11 methyltransferase